MIRRTVPLMKNARVEYSGALLISIYDELSLRWPCSGVVFYTVGNGESRPSSDALLALL